MKKNDEGFHLRYKNYIMRLEVTLHVTRIGWMLPTRCSMSWFENSATQMRQYKCCDVLHSFIQVKKAHSHFPLHNISLMSFLNIQMIPNFVQLRYMFATILLILEILLKECWHLIAHWFL